MTNSETISLILMWGKIAPFEPNNSDASIAWAKWEMENIYHIANFWSEDDWGQKTYGQQIHEDWEDRRNVY